MRERSTNRLLHLARKHYIETGGVIPTDLIAKLIEEGVDVRIMMERLEREQDASW